MFAGLDDIPWSKLQDCYGAAESIPDRLRSLTIKNRQRQLAAIDELGNQICHQASICEATPPVIPYLLELIREPRILNRDRVIGLLRVIAVGLDFDQLHSQTKTTDWLAELELETAEWTRGRRRRSSPAALGLQCYAAVRRGVPDFIDLLDDKTKRVRQEAAYTLAWFPQDHRKTLPRLREHFHNARRADDIANLMLSVGLLEFQASAARTTRKAVLPHLRDRRLIVRYAAAIYLDWHGPCEESLELLCELSENSEFENVDIPFSGHCWSQYAENRLDSAS